MRRILAGVVSGIAGILVYSYAQNRTGLLLGISATLGMYKAINWLGWLPPPFEPDVRAMLHGDDSGPE